MDSHKSTSAFDGGVSFTQVFRGDRAHPLRYGGPEEAGVNHRKIAQAVGTVCLLTQQCFRLLAALGIIGFRAGGIPYELLKLGEKE